MPLIYLLLTSLLWGVGSIFIKNSYNKMTPWQIYAFDAVFIGLPLWLGYGAISGGKLLPLNLPVFLIALFAAISYQLYYIAIEKGPISIISAVFSTSPITTLFLSLTLLGETLSVLTLTGVLLTIGGLVLFSLPDKNAEGNRKKLESWFVFALILTILFGITGFLDKIAVDSTGNATFLIYLSLTQIIAVAIFKPLIKDPFPKLHLSNIRSAAFGITCFNLGSIFFYIALEKGFASIVIPLSNSYILVTAILSSLFLKEKLHKHHWLGIFLVFLGIILVNI